MNRVVKTILLTWLALCFIIMQAGIAIGTMVVALSTNLYFLSSIGPIIGITNLICTIYVMIRVYHSKPADYIEGFFYGKKTLQREEDSPNSFS